MAQAVAREDGDLVFVATQRSEQRLDRTSVNYLRPSATMLRHVRNRTRGACVHSDAVLDAAQADDVLDGDNAALDDHDTDNAYIENDGNVEK